MNDNNDFDFFDFDLNNILDDIDPDENIDTDNKLEYVDKENIGIHGEYYNKFLEEYVNHLSKKNSNQRRMKWIFLVVILLLLVFIVVSTFSSVYLVIRYRVFNVYSLAGSLSGIGGAITSFIILPKIIAMNLFPCTEDDKTDEIFKDMLKHDDMIRSLYINKDNEEKKK